MRLLCALLVAAVALPLTAAAQPRRPTFGTTVVNFPETQNVVGAVEVTNLPEVQDVNVVNAPPYCSSARFQLVGFTSATYTGSMGANFGVTRKCQAEFPDSRMCSLEEAALTTRIPDGLSGAAWVHAPAFDFGAALANAQVYSTTSTVVAPTCQGWRMVGGTGQTVLFDGSPSSSQCNVELSIACCALVP